MAARPLCIASSVAFWWRRPQGLMDCILATTTSAGCTGTSSQECCCFRDTPACSFHGAFRIKSDFSSTPLHSGLFCLFPARGSFLPEIWSFLPVFWPFYLTFCCFARNIAATFAWNFAIFVWNLAVYAWNLAIYAWNLTNFTLKHGPFWLEMRRKEAK